MRPVGLGSNLLAADDGVEALVVRLDGELAAVEIARRPARRRRRRRERGLPPPCPGRPASAGFEFACAIPGTAGGGVRMNAGAYGSDWKAILVRALVVDAEWRRVAARPRSSISPTGTPRSGRARSSRGSSSGSHPRPSEEIRATVAELQARRKATQPTNKRTFGSVFKNPDHELGAGRMIEACGLKGHRIGGALISPRHANFIENAGGATARDALALMAEARRRALEQFGVVLEHEVELLGDLELPPAGEL